MDNKKGIYWHQGLFLQPQHFQQLELNQAFCRKPLFENAAPHGWGVGELEIGVEALAARSFDVRAAKILLRDHTYIEFPGNSVIAPRSFDRIWTDADKPLAVYLGMRRLSQVSPNVTLVGNLQDAALATTRLASLTDPEECPDFYADGPMAAVPTVVQVVKVFFEQELPSLDDYELIQVAQLVRDSDTVRVVPNYVPPTYVMSGSDKLMDILRDIRDDMAGRLRQLEEYKVPRDMQHQDLDPDYLVLLQAVQSLNRFVPAVFHLSETPQVHPWQAYGLLRSIVGELSTFSERIDFMGRRDGKEEGVPAYDHENLGLCFTAAKTVINILLNEISIGPEFLVVLEPQGDYLVGGIPMEYFTRRNRFYLVTQTTANTDRTSDNFLRTARLASPSALPSKIDHALPGIDLIEIASAPQGLPRRSGVRYYRVEQMSADWELVERDGQVGLFWKDAPPDLRAEIVVLRG